MTLSPEYVKSIGVEHDNLMKEANISIATIDDIKALKLPDVTVMDAINLCDGTIKKLMRIDSMEDVMRDIILQNEKHGLRFEEVFADIMHHPDWANTSIKRIQAFRDTLYLSQLHNQIYYELMNEINSHREFNVTDFQE